MSTYQGIIRPLAQYGDPILRKKAEPILDVTPTIREIAEDLKVTCRNHDAIGFAAPQIKQSIRMILVDLSRIEDASIRKPPLILLNPILRNPSKETWIHSESNPVIPGVSCEVKRPVRVHVTATDLDGNTIDRDFEGWEARVLMHENDHINGVLFVDRMVGNNKEKERVKQALKKLL